MTSKVVAKFDEWLNVLQQTHQLPVPEYALEIVKAQLHKRYGAATDMNVTKIARALREINFEEYYDKEDQILGALEMKALPEISPKCQEKIKQLLLAMQPSYIKHSKHNHISFSYVMYKICQQFELNALLEFIKLQISHEKLYKYDRVWHLICDDMKWFFIKSDPTICTQTPVSSPLMMGLGTNIHVTLDRDLEEWLPEEVLKLQKGVEKKLTLEQLAVGHNRSLKNIESQLKALVVEYHDSKTHNLESIKALTGLPEEIIVDVISRHETRKSRAPKNQLVPEPPKKEPTKNTDKEILEVLKDIQTMMRYLISKVG